jgi:muramidase (phage lysozyme)
MKMYNPSAIIRSWRPIVILLASSYNFVSCQTPLDVDQLFTYLCDPKVQAFLDTIAYAEGTFNDMGYRTQFTYKYFSDLSGHPSQVLCSQYKGKPLCSTAAGRYQFLKKTWDLLAPQIKAHNFGPLNQDLAALALLEQHNAIPLILGNEIIKALAAVKEVWASLPDSPYKQPTMNALTLQKIYNQRYKYRKNNMRSTRQRLQKEYDALKRSFSIIGQGIMS